MIDLIPEKQMFGNKIKGFLLENILHLFFRSYFGRKNAFEQEQQIDYLQKKKQFDEELRYDLKLILKDVGYRSDDESNPDSDDDVK
jgi:hypothetical protein